MTLPFVDEHTTRIDAPREVVWAALEAYVDTSLSAAERNPVTRLLGTEPRAGFEISESVRPRTLALAGRHRFSDYRLVFQLIDTTDGATQLHAETFAAFPGVRGQLYRALVVGTRVHAVATDHILRSVRRRSLERVDGQHR